MSGFLGAAYDWVKAAHLIFVIFWMAGLFMLPRYLVYHQEALAVCADVVVGGADAWRAARGAHAVRIAAGPQRGGTRRDRDETRRLGLLSARRPRRRPTDRRPGADPRRSLDHGGRGRLDRRPRA